MYDLYVQFVANKPRMWFSTDKLNLDYLQSLLHTDARHKLKKTHKLIIKKMYNPFIILNVAVYDVSYDYLIDK